MILLLIAAACFFGSWFRRNQGLAKRRSLVGDDKEFWATYGLKYQWPASLLAGAGVVFVCFWINVPFGWFSIAFMLGAFAGYYYRDFLDFY